MVKRATQPSQNDAPPAPGGLAALAAAADNLGADPGESIPGADDGPSAGPQAEDVKPVQTRAESNAFRLGVLLKLARDLTAEPIILDPPLRALRDGLPDARIDMVAGAWGVALDEMGIDFLGGIDLLDHPAIKATMVTAPILWPVGKALWQELKERRPVDAKTTDKPDPVSGD